MDTTEYNGDDQGNTSVQSLEVPEEAGGDVNGEVVKIKITAAEDIETELQDSEDDISQRDTSRTSEHEGEEASEVNGKIVVEEDSDKEELTEEDFESESQNPQDTQASEVEETEGTQEGSEEEERSISERANLCREEEQEEETEVPKKKILYTESQGNDELQFSDDPDAQDPCTEDESVGDPIEEKQDTEQLSEGEEEEEVGQTGDLVDNSEQESDVQSVETEEVIITKDLEKTKEYTKEKKEAAPESPSLSKRQPATESFKQLKDRFSNGTKVEEDTKKTAEEEYEVRGGAACDMSDAKNKRFGGTSEKCTQCNRTVYPMEKMEVAGRLLHKTCFKCCKCNSQLNVGRFSIGGKDMYCMTHYKQAFREKGTYDVFTPDNPIKGKWENK